MSKSVNSQTKLISSTTSGSTTTSNNTQTQYSNLATYNTPSPKSRGPPAPGYRQTPPSRPGSSKSRTRSSRDQAHYNTPDKSRSNTPASRSGTPGSRNCANTPPTKGEHGDKMYGRHYKAFRENRRDKPGGIVCLKFNQQDFYSLLDECDAKRRPFNDRSFPPDISSLCYIPYRSRSEIMTAAELRVRRESSNSTRPSRSSSRTGTYKPEQATASPRMGNVEWRRPKELNPRSRLLSGGKMFRGDLVEGQRGSPNFGAASAALALKHELLFQVMPDDQCPIAFEDDWGIYKFRFWRYGNWTEVTIDDKLPSLGGELLYTHTEENDEHWMCVMEKAYAKFNGCYDVINKIPLCDMLQHLTGGITEVKVLTPDCATSHFGEYIDICFKKRALLLTSAVQSKDALMLGLDSELPYIVTRVKRKTRYHPFLVCLYSPFGVSNWAGPWGRDAPEWRKFTNDEIYSYSLMNESEFDFWISLEDLCEYFNTILIAHQSSDTVTGVVQQLDPTLDTFVRCGIYGNWVRDKTDGGAPNNPKFLTHNAQYLISQDNADDTTCVIALVQRFRPRSTPHEGFMCIGFSLFKAPENIQYRMTDLKDAPVAIAVYSYKESVSLKVNLPAGNYVIVPTSYQPGVIGEYLLRCISANNLNIKTLKQAPPSITKKQMVDIELVAAENLPDMSYGYDADVGQEVYCVIKCGSDKCDIPIKYGPNPIWNSIATFYAKRPYKKTVSVEVWYKPGVDTKDDVCIAESCAIPIKPGDYKVTSQLAYGNKNNKNTLLPRSKASRCAGSMILMIRYNPIPTLGAHQRGNIQVMSLDRGLNCNPTRSELSSHSQTLASNSQTLLTQDTRKCTTLPAEPRDQITRYEFEPRSQSPDSRPLIHRYHDQQHTISNEDMIRMRQSNEDILRIRQGVLDSINNLAYSRHGDADSPLDDLFLDDNIKLMVNSDKTLSPASGRRGLPTSLSSTLLPHSSSSTLPPTVLPPYPGPSQSSYPSQSSFPRQSL